MDGLLDDQNHASDRRINSVAIAFVGFGLLVRLIKFLLNYPLWGDEAFLAVNFLDRGYLDLLRPLDFGQIAPLSFLWAERAMVRIFGFSEGSLRVVPLACSMISVPLFFFLAKRVFPGPGWGATFATAIFAVSFHPIQHAADVKPYASDLLVALALLTLAVLWWERPERVNRLWWLAAFTPLTLASSHPAVFAAGGVSIGLLPTVIAHPRFGVILPYLLFNIGLVCTFLGLFLFFTAPQGSVGIDGLRDYWAAGFPPRNSASAFLQWLLKVHTGSLFAYPGGG